MGGEKFLCVKKLVVKEAQAQLVSCCILAIRLDVDTVML